MMASLRRTWAYRARFVLWLIRAMAQLYLLRMVWTALYAGQDSVDGIPASMMLVYLTVAMLQEFLIQPSVVYEIDQRVMRGTVASDIVRPVGFIQQMLAYDVGNLLGRSPVLLVAVPAAAVVGSMQPPPTPEAAVGYAVSLVLAYLISLLVWAMVGLSAFWMTNAQGVRFLLSTVQGFLSGAMVPLWFLPDGLRTGLELLPFQGMSFLPVSIYVGETAGLDILTSLGIQAVWVAAMGGLLAFVWSRARWKLVVQGG
jgi:ABC-2 type transport system permease protein